MVTRSPSIGKLVLASDRGVLYLLVPFWFLQSQRRGFWPAIKSGRGAHLILHNIT